MQDQVLRQHLVELLRGKGAHLDLEAVFGRVSDEDWGRRPESSPHTLWQLLEHMRFTLHDLLVFSTDASYAEPKWPDDYWPGGTSPASQNAPRHSLEMLRDLLDAMIALAGDEATDLFAPIPWGSGQTILREVLLAADHNSYHLGQAMLLRKQLEA